VPGYDRHFAICEEFGIEMINVPMDDNGPNMDVVEALIRDDSAIKGIWCVPKYSNPTGCIYSKDTVERLAKLGTLAAANFRVFYDNAYVVHDLTDTPVELPNIMDFCRQQGTEDSVLQFGSTSKVTFAGAGVAFMACSASNMKALKNHLGIATIGPDKVNQLRHLRVIANMDQLRAHMVKHAELLSPRFDCVLKHLQDSFGASDLGQWSTPDGGYFISFDTRPGLASEVVKLAAEAGVKLTPAGATFPYGKDPEDRNIRLAPSFPTVEDIDKAMTVFCNAVKLASVSQRLKN
ncbi:MAG TPA: aminotransferase class I/II-fold pyridoxal phosphate-dependent enzyme, partial [Xanthomonadales bacterium]